MKYKVELTTEENKRHFEVYFPEINQIFGQLEAILSKLYLNKIIKMNENNWREDIS